MVSSFPYAKLVRVLRLPLWLWVVPAICAMISIPATFAAVVGGYLVSGPVLAVVHRRRPASPTWFECLHQRLWIIRSRLWPSISWELRVSSSGR